MRDDGTVRLVCCPSLLFGVVSLLTGCTSMLDAPSSSEAIEAATSRRRGSEVEDMKEDFWESRVLRSRISRSLTLEFVRLDGSAMMTLRSFVEREASGVTGLGRAES